VRSGASTISTEIEAADGTAVRAAPEWTLDRDEGAGPFTSRLTWALPGGGEATWQSRSARKRGAIALRRGAQASVTRVGAPVPLARRLRRVNWVAAGAFTVGGSLFAIGAVVAQIGSGSATTAASVYFAGGLFFTTGAYASLLGAINGPRSVGPGGALVASPWRWWSYEPERIDWLSTFVLFTGTLAFGISLINSFLDGLTTQGENRLIWAPEVTGCVLFLIAGHLAMVEICHRFRPCPRWGELAWWIVAINQIGSILFMVSALAAFIRPATSSEINVEIANWGTLTGALCFAVGGLLQAFERPARETAS
jgi:hypothetical protein